MVLHDVRLPEDGVADLPTPDTPLAPARPPEIARAPGDFNLRPAGLRGERPALFTHAAEGETEPSAIGPEGALVSFSLTNDGLQGVYDAFLTDLFVDGVFVGRWDSIQVGSGDFMTVSDWEGIPAAVRLEPGEHTLRLVIDSTNAVAESNETDNVLEASFTWTGEGAATNRGAHLPNLRPSLPENAGTPIRAAAFPDLGRTTALSTTQETYLSWGIENAGLSSIASDVAIHLYYDDTLIADRRARGLVAGGRSQTVDWAGLADVVPITPGEHTLRVIVDPGNLIEEADESDNAFAARLTWGTGPVSQPAPPPTATSTAPAEHVVRELPDLAPTIPPGWDAAIVARSFEGQTRDQGRDGPLSAEGETHVGFALWNGSPVSAGEDWVARVFFDGKLVDEVRFSGGVDDSGKVGTRVLHAPQDLISEGKHEVTLVLDPFDQLREADEGNNICHREFVWRSGPVPEPPLPSVLSTEELDQLVQPLDLVLGELGNLGGPEAAATTSVEDIMQVARAGYHLGTARRLENERIIIHFARREVFESLVLDVCVDSPEILGPSALAEEVESCRSDLASSVGFTGMADGIVQVFVDVEQAPAAVLNTTFHELGHALQQLVAPAKGDGPDAPEAAALREAQAQTFEGLGWRAMGEFLNREFLLYPRIEPMVVQLEERLDARLHGAFPIQGGGTGRSTPEEHDRGYVLMWLAALKDPAGLGLAEGLRGQGILSAELTTDMFNYLLTIPPERAEDWTINLLADSEPLLQEYRDLALNRLVDGLPREGEGHPALRDVALLAP